MDQRRSPIGQVSYIYTSKASYILSNLFCIPRFANSLGIRKETLMPSTASKVLMLYKIA
jgi:hypothetical protein